MLQDTITSGLISDKIWAKVIKEGKDVTLARVMEIARIEVSIQKHIDWMQETVKINYVLYGREPKARNANPGLVAEVTAVAAMPTLVDTQIPRERNPHYPQICTGDGENLDIRRVRSARH